MKSNFISVGILILVGYGSPIKVEANTRLTAESSSVLTKSQWHHGSTDCDLNQDPAIDVYQHDSQSYIIRQNKCLTYEAPFIYVFVGTGTILVLDTGAIDTAELSIYQELENILGVDLLASRELLVAHSHGHSDHTQGDADFNDRANVTLIQPSAQGIKDFFDFDNWPEQQKTIDLGERQLTIIATPGHHEQAISIYDQQTNWLITGDTLYPGYIYVKDWDAYASSINRLARFSQNHQVSAVLGAHIEMKQKPASYYPVGTTYQPNEARLELSIQHLQMLNARLKNMDEPQEIIFDDFIIKPMNGFQKTLSNLAGWLTQ